MCRPFYRLCKRFLRSTCNMPQNGLKNGGKGVNGREACLTDNIFVNGPGSPSGRVDLTCYSLTSHSFRNQNIVNLNNCVLAPTLILDSFVQGICRFRPKRALIARAFSQKSLFFQDVRPDLRQLGSAMQKSRPLSVYLLARLQHRQNFIVASVLKAIFKRSNGASLGRLHEAFFEATDEGKYEEALHLGVAAVRCQPIKPKILVTLSDCCLNKFLFLDGALIAALGAELFPNWQKGEFEFLALRQALLSGDRYLSLTCLAYLIQNRATSIDLDSHRIGLKLARVFGDFNWSGIFALLERSKPPRDFSNIQSDSGINLSGNPQPVTGHTGEEIAGINADDVRLEYYLRNGEHDKIKHLLARYEKGEAILTKRNMLFYGYFASGRPHEAYKILSLDPQFNLINRYFERKIILNMDNLPFVDKALVLSECYTADELNYSRFYPEIRKRINAREVIFTCDHRSYPVLMRTFPHLQFFPCRKARELEFIDNMEEYYNLPSSDCVRYLDNSVLRMCEKADRIITVMRALASVIKDYNSFINLPYLSVDSIKKKHFQEILCTLKKEKGKKYAVGLSWRSSLQGNDRRNNFMKTMLMRMLGTAKDIIWINCQYDGLNHEEEEYFKKWEGEFVTIKDVDQFTDIDDTGSLYGALDMMVSAPTYSADFAASIGTYVMCPVPDLLHKSYCFPRTNINCLLKLNEIYSCRSIDENTAFINRLLNILAS